MQDAKYIVDSPFPSPRSHLMDDFKYWFKGTKNMLNLRKKYLDSEKEGSESSESDSN